MKIKFKARPNLPMAMRKNLQKVLQFISGLKLSVKLTVIFLIFILIMWYRSLSYPIFYYFTKTDRFIPDIINDQQTIYLKSSCDCKTNPIRVRKQDGFYLVHVKTKTSFIDYELSVDEYNLAASTCDLYNVLMRGPNQKVIGLSLYGTNPLYYKYIKDFAQLARKHYPDWTIRIHFDDTIDKSVICELECMNKENMTENTIDFCNVNSIPLGSVKETWNANYMHKMTWRWLPIGDPFVDMYMSRDSDSWIIQREVDSTNEWLKSNNVFHVMRDHPQHSVAILGGMWGMAVKRNRKLSNELFSIFANKKIASGYNYNSKKGLDQDFLGDYVWYQARKNATVHDSFHCSRFGHSTPFPTQRPENSCFISCYDCCNKLLNNATNHICPERCRPHEHKDWIYC